MELPLFVEPSKQNRYSKETPFPMDTVARVAYVASKWCHVTSLYDYCAFLHILLRPSS